MAFCIWPLAPDTCSCAGWAASLFRPRPTPRCGWTTPCLSAQLRTDAGLFPHWRCRERCCPLCTGTLTHVDVAGHASLCTRVCLPPGWTRDDGSRMQVSLAPPMQSSHSCQVPETGSTSPRGVGSSPPARGPRLRPRVWEAPLPGPPLSSVPGEHVQAFQVP